MHIKVSSDWLPSYIKATRPVLEIFRMVGYFSDSPRSDTLEGLGMYGQLHLSYVFLSVVTDYKT